MYRWPGVPVSKVRLRFPFLNVLIPPFVDLSHPLYPSAYRAHGRLIRDSRNLFG